MEGKGRKPGCARHCFPPPSTDYLQGGINGVKPLPHYYHTAGREEALDHRITHVSWIFDKMYA